MRRHQIINLAFSLLTISLAIASGSPVAMVGMILFTAIVWRQDLSAHISESLGAIDYDMAKEFLEYCTDVAMDIGGKCFVGFETAQCVRNIPNVKGQIVMTDIDVEADVVRWACEFTGGSPKKVIPRPLTTGRFKTECKYCPKKVEDSYMQKFAPPGQKYKELPFGQRITADWIASLQQKQEFAIWSAVKKADADSAPTDKLHELFNGYNYHIGEAIDDGVLTPFETGELTVETIIPAMEAMFCKFPPESYGKQMILKLSHKAYFFYLQALRGFNQYVQGNSRGRTEFYLSPNVRIMPLAGIVNPNAMLITRADGNFLYGYDNEDDTSIIEAEAEKRELCMWIDGRMGAQIRRPYDGDMCVNEFWGDAFAAEKKVAEKKAA